MTYDLFFNLIRKANLPPFSAPKWIYKTSNAQKIPQFLGGSQFETQFMEAILKNLVH